MKFIITIILCSQLFLCTTLLAQKADTIKPGSGHINTSGLRAAKRQFAVYQYNPAGEMTSLRIWTRELSFSTVDGKNVIIIKGVSEGADTIGKVVSFSIVEKKTFNPVYHRMQSKKFGNLGFNFNERVITGADSLANNKLKDFSLRADPMPFNWDLDMEMICTLPLSPGRQFAIYWYQPGAPTQPKYYLHTVTGSTIIETADDGKTDCWMLKLVYSKDSYGLFYITKKSRELLKVEQYRNDKLVRCKLRLAVTGI